MNRRTLLAGAAGLGAVLAGCSGAGSGAGGDPNDGDETTTTQTPDSPGTPTDHSFRVVDVSCRSDPGDATVTFDSNEVTVRGRVEAPNGCYTAELQRVGMDGDTLTLAVVSKRREDAEGCIQCLVAVEYEATVAFDDDLPATVVVTHDGSEVARASP